MKVDLELLDDLLQALEEAGDLARNNALGEALGWEEVEPFEAVKNELVARNIIRRERGHRDSLSLVGEETSRNGGSHPAGGKAKAGRCPKFNGKLADRYFTSHLIEACLNHIQNPDFLNVILNPISTLQFSSSKQFEMPAANSTSIRKF